jgi:hypothetical protein
VRFESDLILESGTDRVVLTGDDGILVITSDRLVGIALEMRTASGLRNIGLRQISDRLFDLGATVQLSTPSTALLTMGVGARPQLLTRVAGVPHVYIESIRGLLGSFVRATWANSTARRGRPKTK